ncbi:MAG: hypothetical protein ASARMPRED_008883 [Alectoria sarmentosa]|nr:MAG: hypothetical protein ASARMPRED_008883 [Alectoria sarmentosa]
MVPSQVTLGFGCILLVVTRAIPPYRMIGASAPSLAERFTPSSADNINSLVLSDVKLNASIPTPTPSETPLGHWAIECGDDTTPPGWLVPPETRHISNPTDCRSAIFRVTRGGNPREPQVWTSRADWSFGSCGVFLTPGWSYARVNFPRIDMAEIAQEIERKCVNQEYEFMGGWVAIGGYFIVLLTGRELSEPQPSNPNSGSSQL